MRMISTRLTFALLALALGMAVIGACTQEDQNAVGSQVAGARAEVKDAWASMKTDGETMIDRIQTQNDPKVKQDLLDSCRNTLEKMRKADAAAAGRVDTLCNNIRDADPQNSTAWNSIKDQWKQLNTEFGGS